MRRKDTEVRLERVHIECIPTIHATLSACMVLIRGCYRKLFSMYGNLLDRTLYANSVMSSFT